MEYLHTFIGERTIGLVKKILEENNIEYSMKSDDNYEETYRFEVKAEQKRKAYEILTEELQKEVNIKKVNIIDE